MKRIERFTPGPWATDPEYNHEQVMAADEDTVADCLITTRTPKEVVANARLIAAAPEMYEALEASVAANDSHYSHWDKQGTAGANCPACRSRASAKQLARAALAKARG